MNLNIQSCANGWIVTAYSNTIANNNIVVSSSSLGYNKQEQFVFTNMDEFFDWFKTNFVLEKLTT